MQIPLIKPDAQAIDVQMIPCADIDQGDQLVRHEQNDDEVDALALAIETQGLLQPIGVAAKPDGRWQLLWGMRRLLAHRRLKRTHIAANVRTAAGDQVRATALVENLQRRQLSLAEECDAVRTLHITDGLSPDSIAALLSRGRSWVMRRLAVDALPIDLRAPLLDGTISLGVAERLAVCTDDGLRAFAFNQAVSAKLTVSQVGSMVEALSADPSTAAAIEAGAQQALSTFNAPAIHYACAACGSVRPAGELELVRVCIAGACPPPPTEKETNGAAH